MPCFFFPAHFKKLEYLIKQSQSKKILRGEFDDISVHLKRHVTVYILLVYKRVNGHAAKHYYRLLDSGAVENNKHRTGH